jgi:hypothetical protein
VGFDRGNKLHKGALGPFTFAKSNNIIKFQILIGDHFRKKKETNTFRMRVDSKE